MAVPITLLKNITSAAGIFRLTALTSAFIILNTREERMARMIPFFNALLPFLIQDITFNNNVKILVMRHFSSGLPVCLTLSRLIWRFQSAKFELIINIKQGFLVYN